MQITFSFLGKFCIILCKWTIHLGPPEGAFVFKNLGSGSLILDDKFYCTLFTPHEELETLWGKKRKKVVTMSLFLHIMNAYIFLPSVTINFEMQSSKMGIFSSQNRACSELLKFNVKLLRILSLQVDVHMLAEGKKKRKITKPYSCLTKIIEISLMF